MAFVDNLDNIKDKALDLAQTGVAKSKQVVEIAKLKAANLAEEDAVKRAYIEIGKLYYAERGMAPEAAYAALCEKITAARVNIEENKSRIEELKAAVGGAAEAEEPVVVAAEPVDEAPAAPVEPLAEDKAPEEPPKE